MISSGLQIWIFAPKFVEYEILKVKKFEFSRLNQSIMKLQKQKKNWNFLA